MALKTAGLWNMAVESCWRYRCKCLSWALTLMHKHTHTLPPPLLNRRKLLKFSEKTANCFYQSKACLLLFLKHACLLVRVQRCFSDCCTTLDRRKRVKRTDRQTDRHHRKSSCAPLHWVWQSSGSNPLSLFAFKCTECRVHLYEYLVMRHWDFPVDPWQFENQMRQQALSFKRSN